MNPDRLSPLRKAGIIAVLRAPSTGIALNAVDALVRGGISAIEVTFTTPQAAHVIAAVVDRYGDSVLVGAGTVTAEDQSVEASEAGATFLVSPGTRPELTASMKATGLLTLTGALSPTEVMAASALGTDVVKVFPASVGGPAYLSALRGPFPDVPLMPTGGVTPDNLRAWFVSGAIAVGVGGELIPSSALITNNMVEIERRARIFTTANADNDVQDAVS